MEDRTNICPLCNRAFVQKSTLTRHIRIVHEKLKPYSCKICKHSFSTKDNIYMHTLRKHPSSNLKPFSCEICIQSFYNEEALRRHKRKHKKGSVFECDFCHKICVSQEALDKHKNVHDINNEDDNKSFCYVCKISFKLCIYLKAHNLRYHSIVSNAVFSCDICNFSCTEKDLYQAHIKSHIRRKMKIQVRNVYLNLYEFYLDFNDNVSCLNYCELCYKTFTNLDVLMKHKQEEHCPRNAKVNLVKLNITNFKSFSYSCKVCNNIFNDKRQLFRHKILHLTKISNDKVETAPHTKCLTNDTKELINPNNDLEATLIEAKQNILQESKSVIANKKAKNVCNKNEADNIISVHEE